MRALVIAAAATVAMPARASHCDDPVEGTWFARTFRPEAGDWHEYTLRVARRGNELTGTLVLRVWPGVPDDATIPACNDGSPKAHRYEIPVHGTIRGHDVRIDAEPASRSIAASCFPAAGDYSPDHFVGRLDQDGAIEVRNTDEARYANRRRYRFLRRSCGSR
jgi:hypothetical protein